MTTMNKMPALVALAMEQGARAAEVVCLEATGWKLDLRPGGTVKSKETARSELIVRVWVGGGRSGVAMGSSDQGEDLVGQALASTFESAESPFSGPVEKQGSLPSTLGILDRRHQHLELSDRVNAIEEAMQQASRSDAFEPKPFHYQDERIWRGITNSRGIQFEEEASVFRLRGGVAGHGLRLEDDIHARAFATIASLPIGTRLLQRADALMVDGQVLEEGPVRVVLPPRPMARVLAALGDHFTPEMLCDKKFMLQDIGDTPSISSRIHVVDDGLLPGGLRTRSFDDRGCYPVPVMLLREGVVAGRFLEPERARRLETRPTGHVWGTGLHSNNLVMRGGTRSINALLTERKGPSLMIDDLPDLSTRLNLRTGAFRIKVNGIVMQANKPVGAMRGVTLKGNLLTMLNNVVDICNNTDRIGHIDAASIIADGLELKLS